MSVNYSIQPGTVPSQTGKFYMRVEPKGAIRKDQILENVSSKTLVNSVDAEAVFDATIQEIVLGLVGGNTIIIDGLLSISLSLEAESPITDPNYSIQLPGDKVHANARLSTAVRDAVRAQLSTAADFEKVTTRVRQPQISRVFDVISQQAGKYSPGGPIDIFGADLDLPADIATDTRNGVFFKAGATETRATIYQAEGNLKITCIVPASVTAATVDVIVRTDYEATALREGSAPGIAKA